MSTPFTGTLSGSNTGFGWESLWGAVYHTASLQTFMKESGIAIVQILPYNFSSIYPTGFWDIQRSTDGETYSTVQAVTSSCNVVYPWRWEDSTVVAGTTYYYRTRFMQDEITSSTYSNVATMSVPDDAVYPLTPDTFPMMLWLRASDLTGFSSSGENILNYPSTYSVWQAQPTQSSYRPIDGPFSTSYWSAASETPDYVDGEFVAFPSYDNYAGIVHHHSWSKIQPLDIYAPCIIAVVHKGPQVAGVILGGDNVFSPYIYINLGANKIGTYIENSYDSDVFSSSADVPRVSWWSVYNIQNSNQFTLSFHENGWNRGTSYRPSYNNYDLQTLGARRSDGNFSLTASVAEICIWTGSWTTDAEINTFVENMHDNYFSLKYTEFTSSVP